MNRFFFLVMFFLLLFSCKNEELFKSRDYTKEHEFTSGIEGPAVDAAGILYVVNFGKIGTIGQVSPEGNASLFVALPEGSVGNGIRFDHSGNMFIADYKNHNILKISKDKKEVEVYAHDSAMNQPNDLAIMSNDILFASDPNWKDSTGNIYRIGKDGKFVLLEKGMGTTNGIEVSPNDKYLYVNESVQRKIWRYDLNEMGEISNKKLFASFDDFGSDGQRCDVDGNLYVTRYGKGIVAIYNPEGKLIREMFLKGKNPSNIAFGGKDGRTCYVTMQDRGIVETFRTVKPGREWKMK